MITTEDKKEAFVFYETFIESVRELEPQDQYRFLCAIINYGIYEAEPDFTGIEKALWLQIKNAIDQSKSRRKSAKANGSRGGRPKGTLGGEFVSDPTPQYQNISEEDLIESEEELNEEEMFDISEDGETEEYFEEEETFDSRDYEDVIDIDAMHNNEESEEIIEEPIENQTKPKETEKNLTVTEKNLKKPNETEENPTITEKNPTKPRDNLNGNGNGDGKGDGKGNGNGNGQEKAAAAAKDILTDPGGSDKSGLITPSEVYSWLKQASESLVFDREFYAQAAEFFNNRRCAAAAAEEYIQKLAETSKTCDNPAGYMYRVMLKPEVWERFVGKAREQQKAQAKRDSSLWRCPCCGRAYAHGYCNACGLSNISGAGEIEIAKKRRELVPEEFAVWDQKRREALAKAAAEARQKIFGK